MSTAYFDFRVQDQDGNYIEVDWNSDFKVEFYDSIGVLRFTATIDSSPAINKATDSLGTYYYINGINIVGWAVGIVKAHIYATYKGENIIPYPTIVDAFEIYSSGQVLTEPEITYRQDDFGYISYTFTTSEGASAVLPDWDDNLRIEVYDALDTLRATFTATSDPPIRRGTDSDGNPYIYVDQVNLIDFAEGAAVSKIYAYYGGVPWKEYPIVFKPFGVAIYVTEGPTHPIAWVTKLRRWLRDYPELNRIIRAEETSDRMLREALRAAFDEWNATPPFTGNVTPSSYPVGAVPILLQLAACHVLKSVLLLRARNRLSYSDGGFAVDEEGAVTQEERALLDYYLREASMALKSYKQHLNITQGWGSVSSEYYYIAYWDEDYYNKKGD